MKKITLTIYLAILTLVMFPQNTTAQTESRLDSTQVFIWDHVLLPNDWLMQTRLHYTYGNGGVNYTELLFLQKDMTTPFTWLNNLQFIRTYTVDDKVESNIQQIWGGSSWINFFKDEYTYDESGNNDVISSYTHNGIDWIINNQTLNTYNASNLISEAILQQWAGGWVNGLKTTYTYTGDLLMQQERFNWEAVDWAATASNRHLYSYDGTDISEIIFQNWASGWVNSTQVLLTYDVDDLLQEALGNVWSGSEWTASNKSIYYWSGTGLGLASNNIFKGKAYPNPYHSALTISLKSALESKGVLQIFDVHGKEISKTELNQGVKSIKLNNPYLSKGLYFIHVISGTEKSVFKVLKE